MATAFCVCVCGIINPLFSVTNNAQYFLIQISLQSLRCLIWAIYKRRIPLHSAARLGKAGALSK